MNISNGGPHLLLFERDQQLASLLTSELQLAGYECHTARTAVEVFDAIARFPIRLVLVNLAQAAAARREFWVALDTQRRGRGVQVFTFHCVNLAGYGAQDLDERSQTTMADMEVDGMMGLMSLVDAVRARVPGPGSPTSTMPRLSKVVTSPPPSSRPVSASPTMSNTIYRDVPSSDVPSYQSPAYTSTGLQSTASLTQSALQQQSSAFTPPATDPGEVGTTTGQASYTDRIRAVLYSNQKTWSSSPGLTPPPEVRSEQDLQRSSPSASRANMGEAAALQRLASGQSNLEGARESGLAQLSRLLEGYYTPTIEDSTAAAPLRESDVTMYPATSRSSAAAVNSLAGSASPVQPSQLMSQATSGMQAASYSQSISLEPPPLPANNIEVRSPRQDEPAIGSQPLRAAPIQDLMENRNTAGLAGLEAYARQNSSQVPVAPARVPPLSSIAAVPASTSAPPPVSAATATSVSNRENAVLLQVEVVEDKKQSPLIDVSHTGKLADDKQQRSDGYVEELPPEATMHGTTKAFTSEAFNAAESGESFMPPNSATLIDIMESFPPMPPPGAQPPEPTVLNGRATRSLGSVLLAGHLVPENRLEVAQQIQRMLSGVDMNYQLGEILLMFKLLTPDQLLAASLVSYGLITTQQISALGRIRQELHVMGLEYDLENLLILFRILTPEQIREAKSNRQS